MAPDPRPAASADTPPEAMLRGLLGGMSIFTLAMTVPQVWAVWVAHQVAGVSLLSWSAYLLSAVLWFWFGLKKRDRNIYVPCVGWVLMDAAVVAGVIANG